MAGKWITQGKGTDARHIPINNRVSTPDLDDDIRTTSVMEYPFPEPEIEGLQQAISRLYTDTDEEIHYLLHVKEILMDLEPTFADQEAFDQLLEMLDVVFESTVQLRQRVRNINNDGVNEGFSTKYLKQRLSALTKENTTLRGYFEQLPQAFTPEGRDLIRSEDIILEDLRKSAESVDDLTDFQGVSLPYDNQRDSRDFEHLKKGALHRYLSNPEPTE